MTTLTGLRAVDLRFPTSESPDSSDAVNSDRATQLHMSSWKRTPLNLSVTGSRLRAAPVDDRLHCNIGKQVGKGNRICGSSPRTFYTTLRNHEYL